MKTFNPGKSIRKYRPTHSKIDRLRQHAPTRMYASSAVIIPKAHNKSTSIFLDQSNNASFANHFTQAALVYAKRLRHPAYIVPQGEFIHAVLETSIDSGLPGMIRAVVSRPIYSYQGDRLLIPKGSRLIGQYSSKTLQGMNRIMVVWQRILLPSGISVWIDSPGSDALGESGFLADDVNTHFFKRFGEASLLSILGASDALRFPYQSTISRSFQLNAAQLLHHTAVIKPTLRIYQGARVIVFVARDLDFYSVMGGKNGK